MSRRITVEIVGDWQELQKIMDEEMPFTIPDPSVSPVAPPDWSWLRRLLARFRR